MTELHSCSENKVSARLDYFDQDAWDVSLLALRKFPRYVPEIRVNTVGSTYNTPICSPPKSPEIQSSVLGRGQCFRSMSLFSLDDPAISPTGPLSLYSRDDFRVSVEDVYSMMMPDFQDGLPKMHSESDAEDENIIITSPENITSHLCAFPRKVSVDDNFYNKQRYIPRKQSGSEKPRTQLHPRLSVTSISEEKSDSVNSETDEDLPGYPVFKASHNRTYVIGLSPVTARQNNILNRILVFNRTENSEGHESHSKPCSVDGGDESRRTSVASADFQYPGTPQRESLSTTTHFNKHRNDSLIMKLFHHIHEKTSATSSHGYLYRSEENANEDSGDQSSTQEVESAFASPVNGSPLSSPGRPRKDPFLFLKKKTCQENDQNSFFEDHDQHNNIFKDLMTSRKKRSSSVVGRENIDTVNESGATFGPAPGSPQIHRSGSEVSITEKYGKVDCILGKGAHAIVKLAHKSNDDEGHEKVCAVKEFRKRRKDEGEREYVKKVIAEFCISSTLHHPNVVETIDLMQDENHKWCVIMEYASGGDLYARIHKGNLRNYAEICCYFKQLLHGVAYMHSMGVAHRDLKPENLLLDNSSHILKITDFGVAEVFRTVWESKPRRCKGVCGSEPYISPEEWTDGSDYDPTKADIWACGIIFYAMMFDSVPWRVARESDSNFQLYLQRLQQGVVSNYPPFNRIQGPAHAVILQMLHPNPEKRPTLETFLKDPWVQSIDSCTTSTYDELKGSLIGHIRYSTKHEHLK